MEQNNLVSAQRIHIGFFGMRNAGKSSLVNAVTGQELSVVSDVRGTTTDPVKKAMELMPLGPVVIIDTPGLDDEGALGALRVRKARQMLARVDVAVLVVDAARGMSEQDDALLRELKERGLAHLVVWNKADLVPEAERTKDGVYVSASTGEHIFELKEQLAGLAARDGQEKKLVADLLKPEAVVVLVVPIDKAAPKGRLILPQQQTIRELLDAGCTVLVTRDTELPQTLRRLKALPDLVITDSQVFGKTAAVVPPEVPLTSFSILFARYKGELGRLAEGAARLLHLRDGDRILISEGCTHHRQCGDIGTVKLPGWIKEAAGAQIRFDTTAGGDFPEDLSRYSLVLHCGGCMLTEREMKARIRAAEQAHLPMVNYGVAIAALQGVLERSLELFPEIKKQLHR